ncbi:MarR family winged helix-turn-helix transcriptional regulator [Amaricoccus sp.]|uniref:MarR family winged helix-turn-helix transcriptional regulator n=1 Tax=Amaricoccus sp. TaxID=1872485 RepID=UPI001B5652CE|nr:MarR family winged helix-turn-helix transcriptional regulator [Amaricoccus sp.]MBP7241307.1 winged helix-turn-helix transcriptional regulator [Amaricoccus sp.]
MTEIPSRDPALVAIFGEIVMIEQLARGRLARALPKGMELSHFMTLNHLAGAGGEKTPAQLARTFHVTKGAMTNTLQRLDAAGYIHIRPDWDDARRKWVGLSPAGHAARNRAVSAIAPVFDDVAARLGPERLKAALPFLRALRAGLSGTAEPATVRLGQSPVT